jgi:nicotinamidase-related amidase
MSHHELPIPPHFDADSVGDVWRVPYQERASGAEQWAAEHRIPAAARDTYRICLMLVDVQNTFCIPGFELFVGGASGTAAVDDNRRVCQFIYRNLGVITQVCPTMDTHKTMQVFHSIFLVNEKGEHPDPLTIIQAEDIERGVWRFNPKITDSLGISETYGQEYLQHYARQLDQKAKYDYTIWPYHAMLGGIGHALVSAVEEAVFFHGVARYSQPDYQVKGDNPLTENYSVLRPEVLKDPEGRKIAQENEWLIHKLLDFDAVLIAGQAKSHCVFWTVDDLLHQLEGTQKDRPPSCGFLRVPEIFHL